MIHDDEQAHIARMAAMLDEPALSRPRLTHPSPQHVRLCIVQEMVERGVASWSTADAVARAGCARAAAEHAAAQKGAR